MNTRIVSSRASSHSEPAITDELTCDVAIIGGGIAGLTVALTLPAELSIVLVTKSALGESNTRYAQGGVAAAVGLDDSPELHFADTVAAGAGLVDEVATRALVCEAGQALSWLISRGARFDASETVVPDGHAPARLGEQFALGHEAAHSRRRVLHAHGDATGAEIERALVEAIRSRPDTTILESTLALDLTVRDGVCEGVTLLSDRRHIHVRATRGVALANGGAGQLWLRTSNPAGATADGLGLAWRAGATLADLEFVQFHPTVLVPPSDPFEPFLISEAVRGEGAYLRNGQGERFMPRYSEMAELAPRDVVARAILSEMLAEGSRSAFLDLRHLPAETMRQRFPSITATCASYGLDLARDLIPVAPAAHYFMGGVAVDTEARTTVPNLYAVGEVACTGVHGANRLASNSLLEGLVFGRRAARMIAAGTSASAMWPQTPALPGRVVVTGDIEDMARSLAMSVDDDVREGIRRVMWEHVALRRDEAGLRTALAKLRALAQTRSVGAETGNMLFAAHAITVSALARRESRGGHFRADYPTRDAKLDGEHSLMRRALPVAATVEPAKVVANV